MFLQCRLVESRAVETIPAEKNHHFFRSKAATIFAFLVLHLMWFVSLLYLLLYENVMRVLYHLMWFASLLYLLLYENVMRVFYHLMWFVSLLYLLLYENVM